MIRLVVVLLAVILLHGVHSHSFPKQLQDLAKRMQPLKQIKRQNFNKDGECAAEKFAQLSPSCLSTITPGDICDFGNIASLICFLECGKAFYILSVIVVEAVPKLRFLLLYVAPTMMELPVTIS